MIYNNLKGTTSTSFNIGGPKGPALISGTGVPSNGIGNDGDLFLSKNNNDLYIKRSGVWFDITDTDLITIAGLSQGVSKVIISDGTNWTSREAALNTDLSDVVISSPSNLQVLVNNGSNWVNGTAASSFKARNVVTDAIVTDGTQAIFTLSIPEYDVNTLLIRVGGVTIPPADYTVNGTTLTFSVAPPAANGFVKHLGNIKVVPYSFVGNGTQTAFTITYPEVNPESLLISIGDIATLVSDYTVDGTTLNFTSAPPDTTVIDVRHLVDVNYTAVDPFTGNGTQTIFPLTLPAINKEALDVAVGGIIVEPTDYSVDNKTLTFTSAPVAAPVEVRHLSEVFHLRDYSVTLANLALGTAGNLISYNANGTPVAVATGVAGQILKSNGPGLAPSMQDSGIGETIKESGTFTAQTEKVFTNITKSTRITLTNVTHSIASDIRMETSSTNGASYNTSTGNYYYTLNNHATSEVNDSITDPFIACTGSNAITTVGYAGKFEISLWNVDDGNATVVDLNSIIFSATTVIEHWIGIGARVDPSNVNAVRLFPGAGGTFSADYIVWEVN